MGGVFAPRKRGGFCSAHGKWSKIPPLTFRAAETPLWRSVARIAISKCCWCCHWHVGMPAHEPFSNKPAQTPQLIKRSAVFFLRELRNFPRKFRGSPPESHGSPWKNGGEQGNGAKPEGSQDCGAGVARAWRGRGAGYRPCVGLGGAGVARAWRGRGAGMSCDPCRNPLVPHGRTR
eukprot:gene9891-biopygen4739